MKIVHMYNWGWEEGSGREGKRILLVFTCICDVCVYDNVFVGKPS